jgi:hypothetical protein
LENQTVSFVRNLREKSSIFFEKMRRCDDIEERLETDREWLSLLVDESLLDCLVAWFDELVVDTLDAPF